MLRDHHHLASAERDVADSALALLRGSSLAIALTWLAAVVGAYVVSVPVSLLLSVGSAWGWSDTPRVVAIILVWVVAFAWAVGTSTRLAAWDEVGDRAALQSLRALSAAPWMAGAGVLLLAGIRGALPPVVAAPLFGFAAAAAVVAIVHRSLGIAGSVIGTLRSLAPVTPISTAVLALIGMLAHLHWIAIGGAPKLELVLVLVLQQCIAFAMIDATVGVPDGHVRTQLGRRSARGALAFAWPADAGSAQLVALGILDRARQPRAGATVTLQRLPCRAGLQASRWVEAPGGGELWVAVRSVAAGTAPDRTDCLRVDVFDASGNLATPRIAGTGLQRYSLPPGTWEVRAVVGDGVDVAGELDLACWWALVGSPRIAAGAA